MKLRITVYYTLFMLLTSCSEVAYAQNSPVNTPNSLPRLTEAAYQAPTLPTLPPQSVTWLWTVLQSTLDGKTYEIYELHGQYLQYLPTIPAEPPALVYVCTGRKTMLASLRVHGHELLPEANIVTRLDTKNNVKVRGMREIKTTEYIGGMDMVAGTSYRLIDMRDIGKDLTRSKLVIIGYTLGPSNAYLMKFDMPPVSKAMSAACGVK